jgi:polyvinyl alcohol dehydrogenase (cytochrome)
MYNLRSTMKLIVLLAPLAITALAIAAEPDGSAIYTERCALCHDSKTMERTPPREELKKRTPESVVDALTKGVMREQGKGLTENDMRAVAKFITGKDFSSAPAVPENKGLCEGTPPPIVFNEANDWNGWGRDPANSRYQPRPGIAAADVPKLKLKWVFGFPNAFLAYSQPSIVGGRVFVASATGMLYSLDAKTGCTWWSYKAGPAAIGVRTAPVIAKVGTRTLAFIGDESANTHAVDAVTGELVWKEKLDDHPVARVTGSPIFYQGKLYVPMSSIEEVTGPNPKYECCKFRGSVTALDAATGKKLWKTFTIGDPPKEYKKNSVGTAMYGPAGAAIWMTPTIDTKRKVIYVGTGNSYTDIETKGTNSIQAIDIETGSVKWINQISEHDSYLVGCVSPGKGNCPSEIGPDVDFGASPVLATAPNGKQYLLCGQKSGIIYALDPDKRGALVWQMRAGQGSALGGIEWGIAADKEAVYVPVSDIVAKGNDNPGALVALKLATGEKIWSVLPSKPECSFKSMKCTGALSAAITVIPGVVFAGALDGHLRGYSTRDGAIVWDFDTGKTWDTVNGLKATGGSIDGPGPTVANGMVFTNSGYARFTGARGNVVLAFGIE